MTEFLLGNDHDLGKYSSFLERLFAHLRDQNGDERHLFREMIIQTCQRHTESRYISDSVKDYFMGPTVIASLRIENPVAAKAALEAVKDSFDTSTFQNLGRLGFEKTREFSHDEKGKRDASVVASLYRRLARDDLDKAGQLLEKIANDTTSIHQDDLDRFIIPLLGEMIDIIEHQPSEASLSYSKIISTYIERVVQKEPPKPQNWSLPDDVRECYDQDCPYCSPVRQFLENPSQEDQDFAIPVKGLYKFTRHLPIDYKKTEERSGEDYKIKVTKSLEAWEQKHKKWRSKADHAQSALQSLPETPLRQCLGDGEYQDLMGLRIVKLPTEDMIMEPPNSAQAEAAGKGKRKWGTL
ncbi:hypothetical protein DV737_g1958, partial [Chaetothyriales sp. CBS 132003]